MSIAAAATCFGSGELPKPTTLVPGVRIDWTAGAVELDAKVILRSGPLELIACSAQTREHESILVTKAKAIHVFQARGLAGLQQGVPVTYDEESKKWRPPTGERLSISVKCDAQREYVPVRTWVVDPKTKIPPTNIPWVFAGSNSLPDGRFLADLDGTIICLVDFQSALITVGALHSADNTSLWLEAKTDAIPPIGTRCTIKIAPQTPRIVALLSVNGDLTRNSRPVSVKSLTKELNSRDKSPPLLVVLCENGVDNAKVDALRAELLAAGVGPSRIMIRRLNKPTK